jgi:BolA protein
MEVNELILLIKKKIEENILIQNIIITDKTHLHKKHLSHEIGKFHFELRIKSEELRKYSKIESNKKIYKILDDEIKKYIHSIQILIN